jgi:hypothetical protein
VPFLHIYCYATTFFVIQWRVFKGCKTHYPSCLLFLLNRWVLLWEGSDLRAGSQPRIVPAPWPTCPYGHHIWPQTEPWRWLLDAGGPASEKEGCKRVSPSLFNPKMVYPSVNFWPKVGS